MTLKEQFEKAEINEFEIMWISEKGLNVLETITEEFAIGFAEWIYLDGRDILIFKGLKTTKELLEIYKKEKGL